ncbi:endolytic transglycosylase MltG [Tepidibacillus sp. LV47]|uniref:endolytic transglycosylase MltG n=1 Tax=Tepidibacillus sp. LV47 TaxID=3398228 RepID=UPI003AAE102B
MFRNRNFLMGLGIGLMISSFIFMILPTKNQDDFSTKDQSKPLSIQEIKEAANKYGYQLYTKEEIEQIKNKNQILLQPNKDKATPISFRIDKGMSTNEIADLLYKQHIIKDKQEFLKILQKQGLVKEIKAGTYTYSPNMTMKDVIVLITNKP